MHLAPRTLRHWQHTFAQTHLRAVPLGRPILASTRERRNEVFQILDEVGPGIGLPTLREIFTDLTRAELEEMLRRYRLIWRQLHRQPVHVLHWTMPGRVWAIDFHGPRLPIAGRFPYALAVRDLASHQQLLWQPVAAPTAAIVQQQLAALFAIHTAPLVLKCDNGSAFIEAGTRRLLAEAGVGILFSPPRMPRYNGAIEAGIGISNRTTCRAERPSGSLDPGRSRSRAA